MQDPVNLRYGQCLDARLQRSFGRRRNQNSEVEKGRGKHVKVLLPKQVELGLPAWCSSHSPVRVPKGVSEEVIELLER